MSPGKTAITQDQLPVSPFALLAGLLDGIEPGAPAIELTIGEPRHPMPEMVMQGLIESKDLFGKYPPITGTDEFRSAVAHWLGQRYRDLKGLGPDKLGILPLSGTREGLFHIVFCARARKAGITNPAILMPNPFYHTYAGAAGMSGAEPVFLPARNDTGFLPDLDAIDPETLSRAVAFFLCSPSNPQGAVADSTYLSRAIKLAREHDFLLITDECYSEIYTQKPPPGALETAWKTSGSLTNIISMHSLSKRSNLPGLRVGYCSGDPAFIKAYAGFRNVLAPQVPIPVQHAASLVLRDETHVEKNRELYRQKFEAADRILEGRYGYSRPEGGFFLWLNVAHYGGSIEAVKTLWKDCGVKLLPGRYLARDEDDGSNPGADFVRVAMVQDIATTEEALKRIVETLN